MTPAMLIHSVSQLRKANPTDERGDPKVHLTVLMDGATTHSGPVNVVCDGDGLVMQVSQLFDKKNRAVFIAAEHIKAIWRA
jgi:hypothetical protein